MSVSDARPTTPQKTGPPNLSVAIGALVERSTLIVWRTTEARREVAAALADNASLPSHGPLAVVKSGPRRVVYRWQSPWGVFYVKHDRPLGWWRAAIDLIRGSAARREFERTRHADALGVPVAEAIAYGELRSWGLARESFFVSGELPDAAPLDQWLAKYAADLASSASGEPASVRPASIHQPTWPARLVTALAEFLVGLGRVGVVHNDLHAGNVLIRWKPGEDAPSLALIDLPHLRFTRPHRAPLQQSLVQLHGTLAPYSTPRDLWRLLRAMDGLLRAAGGSDDVSRSRRARHLLARGLLRDVARHERRVCRGRDGRSLASNREFQLLHDAKATVHAVAGLDAAPLVADPFEPIRRGRHFVEKISHTRLVVRASLVVQGRKLFVAYKRFRPRRHKTPLVRFRESPARAAFRLGHSLLMRGINTPRPIAAIMPAVGPESYLATEWIEGAENLHIGLWRLEGIPADQRRTVMRALARSLGELIGRMHAHGVSHRDLKAGNIVCVIENSSSPQPSRVDDSPRVSGPRLSTWLVDLDGVRIRRWLSDAERASNLARLRVSLARHPFVSRGDQLRFLKAYLRRIPGEKPSLHQLARDVIRASQKRLARYERDGQPPA